MEDLIQSNLSDNHQPPLDWVNLIASIALRIRQSLDLSIILQTTADEVYQLLDCDRILLYQFAPDWSGQVVVEAVSSPQWSLLEQIVRDTCFESCWLEPYQEGKFAAINDVATTQLDPCYANFLNQFQIKSNLVIPVLNKSQLWGLIIAHNCIAPRTWQASEIDGLQQIAVHVGIAIHQASLLEQLQCAKNALEDQVEVRTAELLLSNQELSHRVHAYNLLTASLVEKQSFTRQVLDTLFSFVAVLTPDGILLEINQTPLEIAGLTRKDVIGKPFADAYWWTYAPEASEQIRVAIAQANQGNSERFDIEAEISGGEHIIIDFAINCIRDEAGKITHLIPSGTDITERKQTEKIIQNSKAQLLQLAAIVESSQDAIISKNTNGIITSWNQAAERLFGYLAHEIVGQHVTELIPLEQSSEEAVILQRIQQGEKVDTYETKRKHQDGFLLDVSLTISPIRDEEGRVIGASKIARDISGRKRLEFECKQAEIELRQSKERLEDFFENASDLIQSVSLDDGKFLYVNRSWRETLGYSPSEIANINVFDLIASECIPDCHEIYRQLKNGDMQSVEKAELVFLAKDGSKVFLDGSIKVRRENGYPAATQSVFRDITAQRQSQNILNEQTAILHSFYDSAPLMMGVVELSENDIFHVSGNLATTKFLQVSQDEIIGKWSSEMGMPLEYIELWLDHYHISQELNLPVQFEYAHTINSRTYWLLATVSFIGNANSQRARFSYVTQDISDRKQVEAAIHESEARFRYLADFAPVLIWMSDLDKLCFYFNKGWLEFTGCTIEQTSGTGWFECVLPDDLEHRLSIYTRAFDDRQNFEIEYRLRRFDGEFRWLLESGIPRFEPNGEFLGYIGSCVDISDRKRAEIEIKSAKDQLELVLQASSEGFWDLNLTTGDIYFSPQWKALLGYADDELENTLNMWVSLFSENDQEEALKLVEEYSSGNVDRYTSTQRFRHKNGSIVYMLARAIHLKDENGSVTRMIGSHLDMTQLVEIQNALKTSEMQLSGILSSSLDGIMAFQSVRDEQDVIIDFEWLLINPTAYNILGKHGEDLIGKRLLEELPENRNEGLFDLYVQAVETGEPIQRQYYYKHEDIDCWFENIAVKLGDGFAVTFRNITAMKQSELSIQIVNQQLEDRIADLNDRHGEMLVLGEISDFLQACLTVEEACMTLSQLVEQLFPSCAGAIFIISASRNRVELASSWGEPFESEEAFLPKDCWALRRGRIHSVDQHRSGLRCNHIHANDEIAATLCIPMIAQGETLGLFYLNTNIPNALPEVKQQLARTLAEQVSMAIANLRLQETLQQQSIRDPLTGLFNRRYLEDMFNHELSRAQRQKHSIGIIMIDIDHFKRFNDTYGHDAGDYVLKTVGSLLKKFVRSSDIACRYGGEEMILILPDSSIESVSIRAEEIREAIAQITLSYHGQLLGSLTASFGVASFPQHGITCNAVMQAADAALYRAKAAGRNQVLVAP